MLIEDRIYKGYEGLMKCLCAIVIDLEAVLDGLGWLGVVLIGCSRGRYFSLAGASLSGPSNTDNCADACSTMKCGVSCGVVIRLYVGALWLRCFFASFVRCVGCRVGALAFRWKQQCKRTCTSNH